MTAKKKTSLQPYRLHIYNWLCYIIITLAFLLFFPLWVALSAGIASLSIVIFGTSTLILSRMYSGNFAPKSLVFIALICSLSGLLIPQALLLLKAKETGTSLTFNPFTYIKFSGDTTLKPTRSLIYKKTPDTVLKLAFYESITPGNRPTVVLLHGGGWRYGSYLQTGKWPELLTQNGYNVVSVQYRLSNEAYQSWKDAPSDVHDAITYITDNAIELSIDAKDINLLGQSAGGHLALLEAYRFNSVSSVMTLYAPIDLSLDYETSRDKTAELDFIGGPPAQYPQRYAALNPLTYVSSDSPRSLNIQGTRDNLVSYENAYKQREALISENVPYRLITVPFTGHSFENQNGGFATQIAEQSVLKFLNE